MVVQHRKPVVVVYAGPNGSGKSTITRLFDPVGEYINADDIMRVNNCSDLEAAKLAQSRREQCVFEHREFTFETVLSTPRNLELLKSAKDEGYFIRCFYILTASPDINVTRVMNRVNNGGHDVPEDKTRSRYDRALALIPELIPVCDICNVYDNTNEPFRIFSKKLDTYRLWENKFWSKDKIIALTGQDEQRVQIFPMNQPNTGNDSPKPARKSQIFDRTDD